MKHLISVISIILPVTGFAVAQTAEKVFHQSLARSPGGKHLTFTGMSDINQQAMTMKTGIYIVRADASGATKLTK